MNLWLQNLIISKESSDYYSPLTVVKKPNDEYRICLDFCEINKYMKIHGDTVPKIEELKFQFSGAQYFSKIDFRSGFLQIVLEEGSRKYCAFRYKGQPYVFNRLSFGLKDSMPGFIGMLRKVLTSCESYMYFRLYPWTMF